LIRIKAEVSRRIRLTSAFWGANLVEVDKLIAEFETATGLSLARDQKEILRYKMAQYALAAILDNRITKEASKLSDAMLKSKS
jgi:hypothetical protein